MLGDLVYGRPESFHVARARNGLPADVNTGTIARDGTIWIGGDSGLYRFMHPFRLEYWDQQNGVESPYTILHKVSLIYAGNTGIYRLEDNRQFGAQLPHAKQLGTVVSLLDEKRLVGV